MLVWSPILLWFIGLLVARVAKARRVWRRHSLFTVQVGTIVLVAYTVLTLGLLLDLASLRPVAEALGAATGTEAFLGWASGAGAAWPIVDPALMVIVVLSFMAYPFWLWFGVQCGYWLFGRSPKQTGILGLLR